jgi:Ca2+-binding EF-hand superfamily protein
MRDLDLTAERPLAEREEELREDFAYFDDDGDGKLQADEFVRFLDGVGADMSDQECRIGFAAIDTDQDGVIEFDEFLQWWTSP